MAPTAGKYFQIKSKHSGHHLDIKGASKDPGTKVVTWNKHDGDNQVWYEDPLTGTIRSRLNHFCLDLDANRRLIMDHYKQGNSNQQWKFNSDKKTIENRTNSVLVLDICGSSKDTGAEICAYEYHGKDNQQWKLEHLPVRFFVIRSDMNGKVLDVSGAKSSAGAKVILYPRKDKPSDNQLWYEDDQGNIRSKLSEKLVLDASGDHVQTGNYAEGNKKSFWVISGNRIVNKHNHDEVLDVKGKNQADGAEICAWRYGGAANQHWHFDYV